MSIHFTCNRNAAKVRGRLSYSCKEYAFNYAVDPTDAEVKRRVGGGGQTSLLIGTLQLEIAIETEEILFVWGFLPHLGWKERRSQARPIVKALF